MTQRATVQFAGASLTPPPLVTRGGSNRQTQTTGGVDTMETWIIGAHNAEFFRLQPELDQAQEYAKAKYTQQHATLTVNGHRVHVGPRGAVKAKGTLYYDYSLESDGIQVLIMSDLPGEGGQVAYVKIGSLRLMRDGHEKCWHDAQRLLHDLGICIKDTLVARIDVCIDLPGVDTNQFCEAYARRDFIGRAKSGSLYDEGVGYTGFCRGKGGLVLRVYAKLLEMLSKADQTKIEIWVERRCGGVMPIRATRVEFQLRRKWLADWGTIEHDGMQGEARTVEQVFFLLPTITKYLVEHWFRMVDEADRHREHGNQARAQANELWTKVCEAFAAWAEGEIVQLIRKAKGAPDAENAIRQIGGLAASIAAATPEKYTSARALLDRVLQRVESTLGDGLLDRMKLRRSELEASGKARWLDIPVEPLCKPSRPTYADHDAIAVNLEEVPF